MQYWSQKLSRVARTISDADDLAQVGRIAALDAASRHDGRLASKVTFLTHRIRGAMMDEIRRVSPLSRSFYAKRKAAGTVPRWHSFERWFRGDGENDGGEPKHDLPDRSFQPAPGVDREDFWRRVTRGLSAQERSVVLGYARDGKTMDALGRELGFSESRISQAFAQALAFMKRTLAGIPAEELLP